MLPCPSDIKLDKNSIKKVIILNLTFAPKSRSEALHLNIAIYHYIYFSEKKQGSRDFKRYLKRLNSHEEPKFVQSWSKSRE